MTALDIEGFFLHIITLPVGAWSIKGNIPFLSISREQLTVTYTLKVLFICSQECPFVSGKTEILLEVLTSKSLKFKLIYSTVRDHI